MIIRVLAWLLRRMEGMPAPEHHPFEPLIRYPYVDLGGMGPADDD